MKIKNKVGMLKRKINMMADDAQRQKDSFECGYLVRMCDEIQEELERLEGTNPEDA
jgi:hypothetical protein